eukprot:7046122-Alexandrium_andersonii.AAC.1
MTLMLTCFASQQHSRMHGYAKHTAAHASCTHGFAKRCAAHAASAVAVAAYMSGQTTERARTRSRVVDTMPRSIAEQRVPHDCLAYPTLLY